MTLPYMPVPLVRLFAEIQREGRRYGEITGAYKS